MGPRRTPHLRARSSARRNPPGHACCQGAITSSAEPDRLQQQREILAQIRDSHGVYDLYLKPSSGAGREELLRESPGAKAPLSWSSDGRFLLYVEADPKTSADLWTQPLASDGKPSPWLNTPFAETGGQFSPDGR